MPRRTIEVEGRRYLFSADDQPSLGDRLRALARLRVIDELTGEPPAGLITLESDAPLAAPRIASDGLVGLVGFPRGIFPALATQPSTITLLVRVEGYIPRQVEVTLPQEPAFPQLFTPPPLLTLLLHREPVVIMGRTVQATSNPTTPLAGATVRVTGIWRTPTAAMRWCRGSIHNPSGRQGGILPTTRSPAMPASFCRIWWACPPRRKYGSLEVSVCPSITV